MQRWRSLALPYLQIMGWSVIPMLLFLALKQFTDGLEYTKTAMILSLSAIPLNVFLNCLLIYGNWGFPRMELMGAGWGTLITRILIFIVLGLIVLYHKTFRKYVAVRSRVWKLKWPTMKELLHIGIPSSFQITMEAGAFAVSGILIGTIGAVEQAAHQIALSMASLTFMVSMGLSQAGSIRTSNAFGRNDQNAIRINWKKYYHHGVDLWNVLRCSFLFVSDISCLMFLMMIRKWLTWLLIYFYLRRYFKSRIAHNL